jgi:hypothetical protein
VRLPSAEVAENVLEHATDLGYEHRDITVIFDVLRADSSA